MKTDSFFDTFELLVSVGWPTYLLCFLLLGSAAVAVCNFVIDSKQRTAKDVWMCIARISVGGMWWQTLWKPPPYYTDLTGVQDSGLGHCVTEMVNSSFFSIQSRFAQEIILPHLSVFETLVYTLEVFIAVSLILGVFTRLGAVLGALLAVCLWLGLYRSSYEWPWTYFFLILLQVTFAVFNAGRSCGLDAIFARGTSRDWGRKDEWLE